MIINLISGPRNVSTALMYSFAQRRDTIVKDEPFYGYYLKLTNADHPGKEEIIASMETDINIILKDLIILDKNGTLLFLKNMAHHHIDIDDQFLLSVKNVFLIRHPAELIISFTKVINNPTLNDIGLKKSWLLYYQLVQAGQQPIVIDSGELLKDPTKMIQKLCEAIPIPFDPKMNSWQPGPRPEDGVWSKYWYHQLHKSTRFVKSKPKRIVVPEHLQSLCEEAMVYYNRLYKLSIKY